MLLPEVEVALRTTLVGSTVQVNPDERDMDDERKTVPVKPFSPDTVMVDVPGAALTLAAIVVGFARTVKSWTVMVTVAEWTSEPLEPVTVTV